MVSLRSSVRRGATSAKTSTESTTTAAASQRVRRSCRRSQRRNSSFGAARRRRRGRAPTSVRFRGGGTLVLMEDVPGLEQVQGPLELEILFVALCLKSLGFGILLDVACGF